MVLLLIKISTVLTFLFSLALGVYTLVINPKNRINQLWFLSSMAVALWSGSYIVLITTYNHIQARLFLIPLYLGTILIPILFFHFTLKFLLVKKNWLLYLGYALVVIFIILLLFTDKLAFYPEFVDSFGYHAKFLPLMYLLYVYFLSYFICAIHLFYKEYRKNTGLKAQQAKYILLAIILGVGGGATNFIADVYQVLPLGQLLVPLYPVLITYGIFLKKY